MNHSIRTRSALVRTAEAGLMVRNRPASVSEIVFAEIAAARRERHRHDSAVIFAVCTIVIGVFLLVQFIAQVLPA